MNFTYLAYGCMIFFGGGQLLLLSLPMMLWFNLFYPTIMAIFHPVLCNMQVIFSCLEHDYMHPFWGGLKLIYGQGFINWAHSICIWHVGKQHDLACGNCTVSHKLNFFCGKSSCLVVVNWKWESQMWYGQSNHLWIYYLVLFFNFTCEKCEQDF